MSLWLSVTLVFVSLPLHAAQPSMLIIMQDMLHY